MTSLDLTIVVPGTIDALEKGCKCPVSPFHSDEPLFSCGGLFFSPSCPIHRNAVLVEVQRMFGRPQ